MASWIEYDQAALRGLQNTVSTANRLRQQAYDQEAMQTEANLIADLMKVETDEERKNIVAGYLRPQKQSFLNKLMGTPTQRQLLMSSPAAQTFVGNLVGLNTLDQQYKQAQIDAMQALAKSREQSGNKIKPVSPTMIDNYAKYMDKAIDDAKVGDAGNFDFTRDNLLKSWGKFKSAVGYDELPENQQKQLADVWNLKITGRNKKTNRIGKTFGINKSASGEYDWDPNEINPALNTEKEISQKSPYKEYPNAFLEDDVWKVVIDGKKYRIQD